MLDVRPPRLWLVASKVGVVVDAMWKLDVVSGFSRTVTIGSAPHFSASPLANVNRRASRGAL